LLFYHLKLRCYVVVELKTTPFRPEYPGQLNFYLSAIDAQVKAADDQPTIGLLLCKEKKSAGGGVCAAWGRQANEHGRVPFAPTGARVAGVDAALHRSNRG
jgi:hypothetical protein